MQYESYEKKMARCHDEFDVYFARAKLDEELAKEQASTSERRGSLPDAQPAMLSVDVPGHHRRALSCKLPARKRSRKNNKKEGSPKSKESSPTSDDNTHLRPQTLSHSSSAQSVQSNGVSMSYVNEPTLRAPSPRMGSQKCHSAPHSRSSSCKNRRRPKSNVYSSEQNSPENERSRNSSITQFEEDVANKLEQLKVLQAENALVVRNFSLSSKGVINRGDSFKRKPAQGSQSTPDATIVVNTTPATAAVTSPHQPTASCEEHLLSTASSAIARASSTTTVSRVLVIGDRGVGKTALLQQFMTSQYMGAAETSFGECWSFVRRLRMYVTLHHLTMFVYNQSCRLSGPFVSFHVKNPYNINQTNREMLLAIKWGFRESRHSRARLSRRHRMCFRRHRVAKRSPM